MTTPHSIERTIEDLRLAMREGCNCKSCESNLENIGPDCVIRTALTTVAQEAEDRGYTRGRVDEAKTCEGCKKEKEHGITQQPDDNNKTSMNTPDIECGCTTANYCPKHSIPKGINTPDTEWEEEFGKSFKCLFCWWIFGGAFAIGFATVTKIIEIL